MTKSKIFRNVVALGLLLCMAISMAACSRGGTDQTTGSGTEKITYTIEVKSQGGMVLADVGVYVYTDSTCQELVWFAKTDSDGKLTFTDAASDSYVAVLKDVPAGYKAEESYALTGETTQIVLEGSLEPSDPGTTTYRLGDRMQDFTVTATDGTQYTLSELLAEKDAVVLNFWYMNCGPCKAEFPYLQQAYEQFSDGIAVLALNPVESDEAAIAQFRTDNGLTFPMAACDPTWESTMQITGYPTTVVIDRFGTIGLIHRGSITDAQTFLNIFAYFADENYQQSTVEKVESLPEYTVPVDPTEPDPTDPSVTEPSTDPSDPATQPTNPPTSDPTLDTSVSEVRELYSNSLSADVTVNPYKTVYVDWYIRCDMILTVNSSDVRIIYDGKTYEPKNGKISMTIKSQGTFAPVRIGVGNFSDSEKTFTLTMSNIPGSWMNPYTLKLGGFEASFAADIEGGKHYDYVATESGTLTVKFVSVNPKVEYVGWFQNITANTATDMEENFTTVSVYVEKGQKVRFIVDIILDGNNKSSSYKLKLEASFQPG